MTTTAGPADGVQSARPAGGIGSVGQIRQPRLADMVADVLRGRILTGRLPDGARLPKQDDLLAEFRVSRPSLREALRILESEGLIMVQRGNVGGSIVRVPTAQSAAYTLGLVLQSRQVAVGDLAEALRNVEPVAAALCARRDDRMETVVPRLRSSLELTESAIGNGQLFTRMARRFHEEFVSGCGNETLIVMLGTLEVMWSQQESRWATRAEKSGSYPSESRCRAVVVAHKAILEAIERGDAEGSARIAGSHLGEAQRYLSGDGKTVVHVPPARGGPPDSTYSGLFVDRVPGT